MSFNISEKVVCVEGPDLTELYRFNVLGFVPKKDMVYVVNSTYHYKNEVGLNLVGSTVIHKRTGIEVGWDSSGFRKLEEVQAENRLKQEQEKQLINSL